MVQSYMLVLGVASICSNDGPEFPLKKGNWNRRLPSVGDILDFGRRSVAPGFRKTKTEHCGGRPESLRCQPRNTRGAIIIPGGPPSGGVTSSTEIRAMARNQPRGFRKTDFWTKINSVALTLPRLKSYKKSAPLESFRVVAVTKSRLSMVQPPSNLPIQRYPSSKQNTIPRLFRPCELLSMVTERGRKYGISGALDQLCAHSNGILSGNASPWWVLDNTREKIRKFHIRLVGTQLRWIVIIGSF